MKARPTDWLSFGLAFVGSVIAIVSIAVLLGLTGDCAPHVMNCGEPQRRAGFVVLALGIAWLVYLVVRFFRSPTKFR